MFYFVLDFTIKGDPEDIPEQSFFEQISYYLSATEEICNLIYKSENLDSILQNKEIYKFDLVITDIPIYPCGVVPLHAFPEVPVVGVTPFLLPPEFSHLFGKNLQPGYIPQYLSGLTEDMDFVARVYNVYATYGAELAYYYYRSRFEEQAPK